MKKMFRFACALLIGAFFTDIISGCSRTVSKKDSIDSNVPTLTWYLPGDKQDDIKTVLDAANAMITPKINAKLSVQFIDTGSYQEKMTMMIASGNEFDLCFTSDWTNQFLQNVSKGGFLEIGSLIDKNAPGLKNALPNYLWNVATVNNKIYAVPNLQVLFYQTSLVFLKKYVDKYHFDISKVKSVKDIEPFLENIKKNEPGIYPYRTDFGTNVLTSPVYENIQPTSIAIKKDGNDNTLVYLYKTDEYKSAVKLFRSWFLKRFIRPDASTVLNDEQDVNAGKYAVYQSVFKPGCEAETSNKLGQDVVFVPIEEPYLKSNAGMSTMTAVGRNSKNPEKATKLLEMVNTDTKLYNLLSFGIENKHYNKVNDKQIKLLEKSGYAPKAAWEFGNQFNALYLSTQNPGIWELTEK